MFDIGFGELLMIAMIALVVLGPERLPKAARTLGTLLRRMREGWESVRAEVEREIEAEELKQKLKEAQDFMQQGGREIEESVREGTEKVRRAAESVRDSLDTEAPAPPPAPRADGGDDHER